MPSISCPSCGTANAPDATTCRVCGQPLRGAEPPGGSRSRQLARTTAYALLLVAIMHGVLATLGLGFSLMAGAPAGPEAARNPSSALGYLAVYALAVLYGLLAWWAFSRPLPAALAACLLFAGWLLLGAVIDPASVVQGLILKLLIVAVLAQALIAGARHRIAAQQS